MHYNPYPHWTYPYSDPRRLFNEQLHPQTVLKPPSPFPSINTQVLNTSAQRFQELLKQADLLAGKIVNSKEFAHELMEAAQLSNTKKVEDLIVSTGITLKIKTYFSPTGIRIELNNDESAGDCCHLLMTLKW
ncbi:hypothetical protein [Sporosarcina sp. E16_8]|uniref:hypothetical protein n=1 Tax=Sporosarcina sp. E16_8 TaxID=2789295 RepID=UPI0021082FF8|nr:hypothetical protein [Sporosarcina sp. E16_8]